MVLNVFWCMECECCTFWKIDWNSFKSTNYYGFYDWSPLTLTWKWKVHCSNFCQGKGVLAPINPILTGGGGGGSIWPPPCTKSATASRPPQIATRLFVTFFFSSLTHLLIPIDNKLSWKYHIDNVCKTVSRNIGIINRVKQFLPLSVLPYVIFNFYFTIP